MCQLTLPDNDRIQPHFAGSGIESTFVQPRLAFNVVLEGVAVAVKLVVTIKLPDAGMDRTANFYRQNFARLRKVHVAQAIVIFKQRSLDQKSTVVLGVDTEAQAAQDNF